MTKDPIEISQSYLEANLAALAVRSPVLSKRICGCMRSDHVILAGSTSGHTTARLNLAKEVYLHSSSDPLQEACDAVAKLPLMEPQSFLCLGLGLGYYLSSLLSVANPCLPVFAYERDPFLLRMTLTLFDFSRDILAGRVEFILGADIFPFHATVRKDTRLFPHPVLGSIYEEEKQLLNCRPSEMGRRAMVVAGGLFVSDVADALRDSQVQPLVWDARGLSKEETIYQIRRFDPHMVVAINYCSGLPELCESLGVPTLIWEIDPTIERFPYDRNKELSRTFIYTYRKSRVVHFQDAGFSNVEYLPLAANPKRRYPMALSDQEKGRYGADLSFVGSSMVCEAANLHELSKELAQKAAAEKCLANDSNAPLDVLCAQTVHLERGESYLPKPCMVQDDQGRLVDLGACIAETAASERRAHILSFLASKDHDLHVWGDPGWQKTLPENGRYRGLAGHAREITRIYNATKINLDINRIYQQDIVTMRVFDILACKGFVLADHGECLGELFNLDEEVVSYRSESELASLIDHFLRNERERSDIALAGYNRVLRDHTIFGRVQKMLQNLP